MHHHNFKLGLVALLFLGLSSYYTVHYGWYPIASVNGELVLAHDYYKIINSGFIFYTNALATYQKVNLKISDAGNLYQNIAKTSFDKLIEQKLISHEFSLRNGSEVNGLVDKKLSRVKNDSLKEPVAKLYGLTMSEFRKFILEPEAKRELLIEDFKINNEDFGVWLDAAKKNASLRIFIPSLR